MVCGAMVVAVGVRFGAAAAVVVAVVGLGSVAAAQPGALSGSAGYSDVAEDAYYFDAVDALAAQGVFDGTDCGEGRFCPGDPLKRWQMAVWLIRALGETVAEPAGQSRFDDVSTGDWWLAYVERMADLGITAGCSSSPPKYCPGSSVTRGQMASFVTRALDLPPAGAAGFTDVNPDNVHRDSIDRLAAAKITTGCKSEPRQYCSNQSVTKAQMSAFIYRSLEWLKENRSDETSTTAPTPVLISNDTDAFITHENDLSRHVKNNIVDKYGPYQPWLIDTWNHTNRKDFIYALGDYSIAVHLGNDQDDAGGMVYTSAIALTANRGHLNWVYDDVMIHEMAHIYTLSNRIVANPGPIAAAHLYFSEITQADTEHKCSTAELYAETAGALTFGRSSNYWGICPEVTAGISDEAVEIVGQAFRGQMPDWFYDTFQDSSGQLDYEAVWAAVLRMKQRQNSVVNQLRYSFGGYCSEAVLYSDAARLLAQPWVDGGCPEPSG